MVRTDIPILNRYEPRPIDSFSGFIDQIEELFRSVMDRYQFREINPITLSSLRCSFHASIHYFVFHHNLPGLKDALIKEADSIVNAIWEGR